MQSTLSAALVLKIMATSNCWFIYSSFIVTYLWFCFIYSCLHLALQIFLLLKLLWHSPRSLDSALLLIYSFQLLHFWYPLYTGAVTTLPVATCKGAVITANCYLLLLLPSPTVTAMTTPAAVVTQLQYYCYLLLLLHKCRMFFFAITAAWFFIDIYI